MLSTRSHGELLWSWKVLAISDAFISEISAFILCTPVRSVNLMGDAGGLAPLICCGCLASVGKQLQK